MVDIHKFTIDKQIWQERLQPLFDQLIGSYISKNRDNAPDDRPMADLTVYPDENYENMEKTLTALFEQAGCAIPEITRETIPDIDWLSHESQFVPAIEAGDFWIYGDHIKQSPPPGLIPIRINAAAAFGTGDHGTTAGCLAALTDMKDRMKGWSILDMGCGSAILAIAAAKLGAGSVLGIEIDPRAAGVAAENIKVNQVDDRATARHGDGVDQGVIENAPYDLILANILAEPLITMAAPLTQCMSDNGRLILSGILLEQENMVTTAYAEHGMKISRRYPVGRWQTLVLAK